MHDNRIQQSGYSLIELLITLVLVGLMGAIALPMYGEYAERGRVNKAIGDLKSIELQIERFRLANRDRVPASLTELGTNLTVDPWGRNYVFLNIIDGSVTVGDVRKDGALNPLNTDYDLYSLGKDGETAKPLNAAKARDDVVRANNGAFLGLAEDY